MKNNFISKVFSWLFIGLLIAFGTGYFITTNDAAIDFMLVGSGYYLAIIVELISGFGLSIFISKMSDTVAKILYLLYSAVTGVTMAALFLIFETSSIIWVLLATALIFGIFSLVGSKLKINLSGWGTFLLITLISIIVLEIINIFVMNQALDFTICVVGIVIFVGYIIFDINRIIQMRDMNLEDKYAIFAAFQLYLDIINIIVYLLRLFGRRND